MEAKDVPFESIGAISGDPRSSDPGVVGRELSCPASLNTRSNIEEVRLVVDCGEAGPEEEGKELWVRFDWVEKRFLFDCGMLTAVCCKMVAADEGVP